MKKINIAIDGFSSCGKSTIAKAIAARLGYIFIDTGAMYRAVTLFALDNGFISGNQLNKEALVNALPEISIDFVYNELTKRPDVYLQDVNVESKIRTMEVSSMVSPVAAIKEVRQKLVAQQQKIGEKKGVVMDGRDIGTVVFPNAELKLFITADQDVRTKRRLIELEEKGMKVSFEEVKHNLLERDRIDTTRAEDPLRQAEDAIVIDNSNLTIQEQMKMIYALIEARMEEKKHEQNLN